VIPIEGFGQVSATLTLPATFLAASPPWQDPELFFSQIMAGLATGSIYGLVALGVVLIYRSTDVLNFAQGEMALLVTFVGWSLVLAMGAGGADYWLIFFILLALAGALGAFVERTLIRPVEGAPVLNAVIVTLGLFVVFRGLIAFIWAQGELPKGFPATPLGSHLKPVSDWFNHDLWGFARITQHQFVVIIIAAAVMLALYLLFNHTKLGLAMRATAQNPLASRLMGINVGRMLMLGWALAGMVGAVGAILVAPMLSLDLVMMLRVILFAFAAAVLGGLDSPPGAIVGGVIIGVVQNLASTYSFGPVFFGPELSLAVALLVLVLILLVRPTGIFGRTAARRV
jgi:branched-chain amino acid transport system permease protein